MQALIAEFDEKSNAKLRELWIEVGMSCGKEAEVKFPYPHFTWQGAGSYAVEDFEKALLKAFENHSSFIIKLAGLGIFTNQTPILYLNMVKTPLVCAIHQKITCLSKSYVTELEDYWLPDNWMPHLTLVEPGTSTKLLRGLMPCLMERPLDWVIEVVSFSLYSDEEGEWNRKFQIDLKK